MNEEFSEEEFEDKRLRILLYGSLALAIWMIVSGIILSLDIFGFI